MYERRLLERIEVLESQSTEVEQTPVDIETRSVICHLRNLLNTNRGSVCIDPDYGMPDMTVFSADGLDETRTRVREAIRETVTRYEKRLTQVKINIEPEQTDALTISFSLEAVLSRHCKVPVFFHSRVNPSGRIDVKK